MKMRIRKVKLTPLGIAALALLTERPMHPYEMFQTLLSRHVDRVVKVRPGSLYHTVARLADDDLVRAIGTEREGNRPERTSYEITDEGRDVLREQLIGLLSIPEEEYPAFPLALTEADIVEPAVLADLLRRRLFRVRGDLASYEAGLESVTAQGLPEAYWLDLTYLRDVLAAEVRWLERTVARLESGELTWPEDPSNPQTHHHQKEQP
ncbi:PadR family transcriptional regulator [Microlunatus ginsengisoli]|uniref:PadR family transcriptional regulator n=1 Tax=Microlunatus ginsengisoli TaxID=363863 RepID=A0ABP7A884_9ACTN